MANTYTLISSVTVGSGGAANIQFTSIPATYTDLLLKVSPRQSGNVNSYQFSLRFNGNSSSIYNRKMLFGYGTGVDSQTQSNVDSMWIGFDQSNSAGANIFGNYEVYIPNYASSNQKSLSADSVTEENTTDLYGTSLIAGLWANTAAITSILLQDLHGGTNLLQYSTAYLYGISNA
jgi:hypothetical protein